MRKMIVVGLLGLFGAACGTAAAQDSTEPVAVEQAPVQSTTPVQAATQTVPVMEDGLYELQAAATSADAGDVDGVIEHTNNAAASWDEVSSIWDGVDPYISSTSAEVAGHLYAAASDVESGDYNGAVSELNAGNGLVEDMTSYLDTTYLSGSGVAV